MKHIKKFNETKKDEKVEDQEVLFNAEVLADEEEKPSFNTSEEDDQEKVKKEFDKLRKVKKFENFTIEVEVEVKPEEHEGEMNIPQSIENQYNGGQEEEGCESCGCQDCACGPEVQEVEQSNPETDVKVMNIADFMKSITGQ
jgi:hypothetical protein